MSDRASIFEDDAGFDVSQFAPKQSKPKIEISAEEIRAVAEKSDFPSREPVSKSKKEIAKKEQRRYRTGRNIQLTLKVRAEARDAFYAIADAQNWVLGETLERAVAALQKELGVKAGQGR